MKNLIELYRKEGLGGDEFTYLHAATKLNSWINFTDEEKQLKRKSDLNYTEAHFKSIEPNFDYIKKVVEVTDKVIDILKILSPLSEKDYEQFTSHKKAQFRFKTMLLCEKEFLFHKENARNIAFHVPANIFEEIQENFENGTKDIITDFLSSYHQMLKLLPPS